MVRGDASCMQPGAYLLVIPTIVLGADQLLISIAISSKRYSEDRVEHTCVCCVMLTGAAARHTLSRRRMSTKRHSLLCRAKKSDYSTSKSGLILPEMIRSMLRKG
jgi:hypothetical protein